MFHICWRFDAFLFYQKQYFSIAWLKSKLVFNKCWGKKCIWYIASCKYENNIQDTDQQFLESLHCEKKNERQSRPSRVAQLGEMSINLQKLDLKKSLNWRIILVPATVWQRGYQIGNTKIDLGGDLPVFEIETWNFQQMLDLGFSETWQNFSSFRQRFFHSFKEGTKGKMLRNCPNYTLLFEFFSFGNYEKKCLKELKFCEVSGNPKSSINDRE